MLPILLLAATPVRAQPAPQRLQPSRDVVVNYRVEGEATRLVPGGIQGPVRLSWDAAGQRLRAEAEGRSQIALIDLVRHTGQTIDTGLRVVLPLPLRANELQPLTLEGARLTPRGHETVAGVACTTYQVDIGRVPGVACLTADGVPLRGEGEVNGKPGRFTAISVAYGTLPASLFVPPPGYITFTAPEKGGVDLRSLGALLGRNR